MKLLNKILDERNIFNSIYSMESYVFERGLLDSTKPVFHVDENGIEKNIIAANDLELYYALSDKHNIEFIESVISCCQEKLKWIFKDKNNLFNITVYFKLKNYDSENKQLKFRPIHTARLIDLICMVSILNCLMFDDDLDKGERKLSDLSKLLPHNFYGNIPSTDVQYLFHKWQRKYNEYTNDIIEHCRKYKKSHSYKTEVCLDIKNFYPSISPNFLFNYITGKLSKTDFNNEILYTAIAKLVCFKIEKQNIESWIDDYYHKEINIADSLLFMNYGIPQGLPQSFFFGNLCMLEIKRIMIKDEYFKGEAFFYVDDSVIYIQEKLDDYSFKTKIKKLNNELENWYKKENSKNCTLEKYIGTDYIEFQNKLNYAISFHEEDKSIYTPIDDTYNQYGQIAAIIGQASMGFNLSYNLDEVDDQVSLSKLNALDEFINEEIRRVEKTKQDGINVNALDSILKLLKRLKKYFLYRNRLLKIKESGGPDQKMINQFNNRFLDKSLSPEKIFNQLEEDIFVSEYRLYIQTLSFDDAKKIMNSIKDFENRMLLVSQVDINNKSQYLYYSKDVDISYKMKNYDRNIYASLIKWSRRNFGGLKGSSSEVQIENFRKFLLQDKMIENEHNIYVMRNRGFGGKRFTLFVINSSIEYQRRILNVYFSEIIGVVSSDALIFTKTNARRLIYTELRILAYLRNKELSLNRFEEFVRYINEKDISNKMGVDMGILEVLNIFIKHVRKPEWVDSLIHTHRIVKGLWYNGSKFLNSYTLHNEEHAVTLIIKTIELINRIDYFALKNVDFYILYLSCYLHDISMVVHPDLGQICYENEKNLSLISSFIRDIKKFIDSFENISVNELNSKYKEGGNFILSLFNEVYTYFENFVRENHASDSSRFIRIHSKSLLSYLETTLLSFVAKVSESHGYDVIDIYGLKSHANDDTVSLKYLMILIRLADLLDVANERVNYHLLRQNLKNMSLVSKFHWISHLVTDKIELTTDYKSNNNHKKGEKPIIEEINLILYINFKQLTYISKVKKCKGCRLERVNGEECLKIRILGNSSELLFDNKCNEENCTVLCYWMMKKHEWLIKELLALNEYLYAVNSSLINTNINFIIKYCDDMRLDADMFDSIQEYLDV